MAKIARQALNIVHAGWMSWRHMMRVEIESRSTLCEACEKVDDALRSLDDLLRKEAS